MPLQERLDDRGRQIIAYTGLALAALALAVSIYAFVSGGRGESRPSGAPVGESTFGRIQRTGVLRAGYGGFPPYTIVDPSQPDPNMRVRGFVVDMVAQIASRHVPPLRVEWHNLDWDTLKGDMLSMKFDFLADAVYQTIPRASDFAFTEPFSYFGIAAAVVRKGDRRFKKFEDLDRADITIAVAQGWTSTEYAQRQLSKPKFKPIIVGKDAFIQLDDVLLGRADVALQDVPTVFQYVKAHADRVEALWLENPPSWVAAGFLTRKLDTDLREFLNASIRILKTDGTLKDLDRKWNSLSFFERQELLPGAGLLTGRQP